MLEALEKRQSNWPTADEDLGRELADHFRLEYKHLLEPADRKFLYDWSMLIRGSYSEAGRDNMLSKHKSLLELMISARLLISKGEAELDVRDACQNLTKSRSRLKEIDDQLEALQKERVELAGTPSEIGLIDRLTYFIRVLG